MQVINTIKLTGDGAAHPMVNTAGTFARWVQFVAESIAATSAPARTGGPSVSSTVGAPLFVQGASQFFPQDPTDAYSLYDLSTQLHYFLASGDTGSIMYGI